MIRKLLYLGLFLLMEQAVWGALSIDVISPADQPASSRTVTTSAFSTTGGNELLLAFIATDYVSGSNTTVTSVSGAGLTWVLVVRTNAQSGTSEIWRAFASTALSNVSVTARLSQSVASSLTVVAFKGVDTSGTYGSGAIGAIGRGSASYGAPTASLVTTRNASWVFGVGNDYDNPIARTVGSGQTMLHQYMPPVGDTYWVQAQSATTALSGTTVTINDTAPTSDRYNLAICEVLPASTGTGTSNPPSITSFSASPSTITARQTTTLSWTTSGATSASISPGVGTVSTNGSTTVVPASTTTYTLTATNSAGSVTGQTVVTVTQPTTTLLFDDEFSGSALDTNAWVAMNRPGDASNSEVQYYLPSNIAVGSGNLTITSKSDRSVPGYYYTSDMAQWRSFNFTYGTVEVRAKMAGGQGTWPAVWMLGANCQQTNITSADNVPPCNWPNAGSDEIDIAEIKNGNLTTVYQNVISGNSGFKSCTPQTTDTSTNWHTYTLVWAPSSLTWKIDGTTTCVIRNPVPSTPMFLMINTAMGGSGGGTIKPSTLPQTLSVDYVRVSQGY